MKIRNIEHQIRHLQRRIAKCEKHASVAFNRNHNIIGIDFLNKAMGYEIKLAYLQNIGGKND